MPLKCPTKLTSSVPAKAPNRGHGQGFLRVLANRAGILDRANRVIGFDLKEICFNGPEDRLNQTDVSQPAIYVTSVACYATAQASGAIRSEAVTAYAGLSLGEYTALHLAGHFDLKMA